MIQSIQKVIKIGSSGGVTIPAKDLKRQNIKFGDEVEIVVRPISSSSVEDRKVVKAAKSILESYHDDFKNLAER
jgi:bifunctional DNA-binding transcriptional regulator/antitoxin component of YhaV-PrlF toxin-antitoxin module